MAYVKTYLPTLKTHVVNLKRDAKDLSRDLQRLEVRGKLGSKTLYYISQTCDQERFEARKVIFSWECLNSFATGCSFLAFPRSRSS